MKVALTIESLSPDLTGVGRYTWELATRLARDPEIDDLRYFRDNGWIADPARYLRPRSRIRIRPPLAWRRHMVRKHAVDRIFHGPNFFLPRFIDGGIITVHDLSIFHFPETHPVERIRHFERDFSSSLERAAHIITPSQTIKQELIGFAGIAPDRVTAIPLAASDAYRPRTSAETQPVLCTHGLTHGRYTLCVSTIEPRKKIAELLEAWKQARQSSPAIPLVIVGGGGWRNEEIKAQMAKGTAEGWLRCLGYVPEKDLPALYAGAALFVYPSSYEGFGLPPIEAMASGIPTIVSDRSCLPEVTQGAALTTDPFDKDGFAQALERGLTDEQWRAQAIAAGLQVTAGYTWDRCAAQTREVYQTVRAGRKSTDVMKEMR